MISHECCEYTMRNYFASLSIAYMFNATFWLTHSNMLQKQNKRVRERECFSQEMKTERKLYKKESRDRHVSTPTGQVRETEKN